MADIYAELGLPRPEQLGKEQDIYKQLGVPRPEELQTAKPADDLYKDLGVPSPEEMERERRAEMGEKGREFRLKMGNLQKFMRNIFGGPRKDPSSAMRMYMMGSPKTQQKVREVFERHPAAALTPPHIKPTTKIEFEPGGKMRTTQQPSAKERTTRLLETIDPHKFFQTEKKIQPPPPDVKAGDIIRGGPMLKQGEEELKLLGKPLPIQPSKEFVSGIKMVGGPLVDYVIMPVWNVIDRATFRNLGGFAAGMKRGLQKMVMGERPEEDFWDKAGHLVGTLGETWAGSVFGEQPQYLTDLYQESLQDTLGRPLTLPEQILSGGMGLVTEMWLTGKLKMFPEFGPGPAARAAKRQVEWALKEAKTARGVTAGQRVRTDAQIIRDILTEEKSFPEQLRRMEYYVENLAKGAGVEPKLAIDAFRRSIGKEGKRFGRRMMTWFGQDVPFPASRKVPEEGLVPFGARYAGGAPQAVRAGQAALSWGAGLPKGAKETMREAGAAKVYGEQIAERARGLERLMGGEEESRRLTKSLDLAELERRKQREVRGLEAELRKIQSEYEQPGLFRSPEELAQKELKIKEIIGQKEEGYRRALERAGLTTEDVQANISRMTPSQAKAAQLFRRDLNRRFDELQRAGVDVGYLEDVIPHIETKASKARRIPKFTPTKQAPMGTRHARHRLPTQAGVGLGGTGLREFEQRLGDVYAQYMQGTAVTLANARTENLLLRGYGRRITREMQDRGGNLKPDVERMAKAQGLSEYKAGVGWYKDQSFLVDQEVGKILQRARDPKQVGTYLRAANGFLNWWKARATVVRPGFMVRNILFGNLYQEWLAGIDIMKSNRIAARLQALDAARQAEYGGKLLGETFYRKLAGTRKIGKYTPDELLDLAYQHKVLGGGMFGEELRGAVRGGGSWFSRFNPFSSRFAPMQAVAKTNRAGEDNARLAVFVDRLMKGYTPQEAAAAVAKYIFNYDELTAFGKGMRQIMPFWTWTSKNWGLQIATALQKPGKHAMTARTWKVVEDLDPLSPEDSRLISYAPKWMGEQAALRVPGVRLGQKKEIVTDPTAGRAYVLGANTIPAFGLLQLVDPAVLPTTLGDMLHPALKMAIEQGGYAPQIHWGTPFVRSAEARRLAPGWAPWLMRNAKRLGVEHILQDLFWPIHDPVEYAKHLAIYKQAEQRDPETAKDFDPDYTPKAGEPLGYTWPSWVEYAIQSIDPGLATFNRVLKQNRDEDTADALAAAIFGVKLFRMGEEEFGREYSRQSQEAREELMELNYNLLKHGKLLDPKNPFRMYYPK